jgi:hypothetical protein
MHLTDVDVADNQRGPTRTLELAPSVVHTGAMPSSVRSSARPFASSLMSLSSASPPVLAYRHS